MSVVAEKLPTKPAVPVLQEIQRNSSQLIEGAEQKKSKSPMKSPRKGMPQQTRSPKKTPVKLNFAQESIPAQADREKPSQISFPDAQFPIVSSSTKTVLPEENSKISNEKVRDIDADESDEEIHAELQRLNQTAKETNYIPNRKRKREDESPEAKEIKRARWESQNLDDSQDEDQNVDEDQNESLEEEIQNSAHVSSMPVLPQIVLNPPIRPMPRIPVQFNLAQLGFFQNAENQLHQKTNHYYGSLSDQASPLNCDRGFIARKLF